MALFLYVTDSDDLSLRHALEGRGHEVIVINRFANVLPLAQWNQDVRVIVWTLVTGHSRLDDQNYVQEINAWLPGVIHIGLTASAETTVRLRQAGCNYVFSSAELADKVTALLAEE